MKSENEVINTEVRDNIDTATFGFWVYIMTDCVVFASLFATYAVMRANIASGPASVDIFSLPAVLIETLLLLTSSFTSGLGLLAAGQQKLKQTITWFSATFLLGAGFLAMELTEFRHLVQEGHSWRVSGFLSSFFTLVGTHGLHITIGLLWLAVLLGYIVKKGLTPHLVKKLKLFGIFWHFLDVIWIFIFTIVYLMGVIKL